MAVLPLALLVSASALSMGVAAGSAVPRHTRPVEYATVRNGSHGCTSGLYAPMPNFYGEVQPDNIVPAGQEHGLTRWSCVVWPYHRLGVVDVVDFAPSPRPADDNVVRVNDVPFLSASPGITLWRVLDAHAGRSSEGTLVFTRTHVFPGTERWRVRCAEPFPSSDCVDIDA